MKQEGNTVEKFNTSSVLMVNIEDGDDQYPHFLPCTPVSPGVPVCMNPTYTTNITHKQQVNKKPHTETAGKTSQRNSGSFLLMVALGETSGSSNPVIVEMFWRTE